MRLETFAAIACIAVTTQVFAGTLDTRKIEAITGIKGEFNEKEGVFKVSFPRKDLQVKAAGVTITPAMGLTAWAAFTKPADHTMVMGDIVLTEDQVNHVMSVALDNGLEVTALHNHFFFDTPKVMFMHIGGMGGEEQLATAVGKVFAALKEPKPVEGSFPHVDLSPSRTSLSPKKIEDILGEKGQLKDGVYKVTMGQTTKMQGQEVGKAMGVNTWAAFIGSDDKALVDGDFAMFEDELQGVLKALRSSGINIVAIHNHMVGELPRIVFLHYWGVGDTAGLTRGLKKALETQGKGVQVKSQ